MPLKVGDRALVLSEQEGTRDQYSYTLLARAKGSIVKRKVGERNVLQDVDAISNR